MRTRKNYTAKWREYQTALKKNARRKHLMRRAVLVAAIAVCVLAGLSVRYIAGSRDSGPTPLPAPIPALGAMRLNIWPGDFTRQDFADYLNDPVKNSTGPTDQIVLEKNGSRFRISTTIDAGLQKYITQLLSWSRTRQTAVVVLNPYDGRVLAMAGRDTEGSAGNICLRADFPAASLFKIVSASAALEAAGYTPDKTLFFNGSRHTLYKNQLKESRGRYSRQTSFRKAFAASNNSVFGKIGIYDLGQKIIRDYADRFLFNRPIPFDLPMAASSIAVPDDDFGLAEIASGFNKRTLVSPLHAALLAATAANGGNMVSPWFVSTIADETQKVLYRGRPGKLYSPINSQTAETLKALMQDTVRYGTSRTAFKMLRRKNALKTINLGAKTGTINDKMDQFKYDWITVFAVDPEKFDGICIAILAVHGKLLGTRATEFARAIIQYLF